jgi:hypothetical protein
MANNQQDGFLINGPTLQSILNTDLISGVVSGWQDVSAWGYGSIQIIATAGISAGTVTLECSNDGVTAQTMTAQESTLVTGALITGAITIASSTSRIFNFPINTKYIRARISTAFVGGTISAVTILKQTCPVSLVSSIRLASATTLAVTSTPVAGTTHTLTSAATTNATSVKATAGALYTLTLTNLSAASKFFKLYAKASAPTVGTDIPIATIPVAATSTVSLEFGAVGQQISTGIAYAITNLIADTDTTAVAAGDVKVLLTYI